VLTIDDDSESLFVRVMSGRTTLVAQPVNDVDNAVRVAEQLRAAFIENPS
jgi:5,10-methylenetetrahydrofolate reductase